MFYLVRKPVGISSFECVRRVGKRWPKGTKIWHSGTLDPLASGLLLVAVNSSTRLLPYLPKIPKTYEFTVRFDGTTESLDLGTPIQPIDPHTVKEKEIPFEAFSEHVQEFLGETEQVPPIYSALNINGKRAYEIARKGKEAEMPTRKIRIDRIEILEYAYPEATIRATVSEGTYIRSLARDIGQRMWLSGYVTSLVRTEIQGYPLEAGMEIDELDHVKELDHAKLFPDIRYLEVTDSERDWAFRGNFFPLDQSVYPVGSLLFLGQKNQVMVLVKSHEDGTFRIMTNAFKNEFRG